MIDELEVRGHLFEHFGVSTIVEVVGGVDDGDYSDFLVVDDCEVDFATQCCDAGFVEDALCCEVANGDDDFWLHDVDELV